MGPEDRRLGYVKDFTSTQTWIGVVALHDELGEQRSPGALGRDGNALSAGL